MPSPVLAHVALLVERAQLDPSRLALEEENDRILRGGLQVAKLFSAQHTAIGLGSE